jgi:hypothetical protein
LSVLSAQGGGNSPAGAAGTIFTRPSRLNAGVPGDLILDNGGLSTATVTLATAIRSSAHRTIPPMVRTFRP